jgi:sirohydrochlorin ferrochelatase
MLALICSLLATTAAPAGAPLYAGEALASKQRPILGGANTVSVSDERVQAAAAFAAESVDGTLEEVTSATRQVVAGTIYRITFTTTDGRSYSAEVFHSLQGEFSVRSIDETGDTGSNEAEGEDE